MTKPIISFGDNDNQRSHTFRHVAAAGLDPGSAEKAITADLSLNYLALSPGFNQRAIELAGRKLVYHVYQFSDGRLNIAGITVGPP
jgi:hypothetical protein